MFTYSFGSPSHCFPYRIMKAGLRTMLFEPWFIGAVTLTLFHQLLQIGLGFNIPILDSYLDPLLFLPVLLHLILLERRFLFGKGPTYVFSWTQIIMIVALIAVLCEYYFPRWNVAFTADYLDIVCYLIGGTFFGIFFNTPLKA